MGDAAWARFLPPFPPPPFATPAQVIAQARSTLTPHQRIRVEEWADRSRWLDLPTYSGPWLNSFAPYMTEPQAMVTSRRFIGCAFCGPARTVKSESLILNTIGHAIDCRPRDILVICQTQDSAKQFSERKLGPMLRANRALAAKQLTGRGADNIHEKRFAGGMNLQIRWPVIGYFSQNEYFTVLETDYDRFPADVDGEGSAFSLGRKRIQQAGSLGMVVAESSPGFPIEVDDDWTPSTLHEAPPCGGILAEFNQGTRGKWYWTCPSCSEPFQPLFERLQWEMKATPAESAKTVFMSCPNGCVIGSDRKHELNLAGQWLHETGDGQAVVPIDDSAVRDTDVVSWWMEGPAAAMQSWDQLAQRAIEAEAAFRERGDEQPLKSTVTLDQGRPHRPKVREIGESLSVDALKALSERRSMGVAPEATRFITLQVDVQASRFVVSAEAWGRDLEHWLIDRFDIAAPPEDAPGAGVDAEGRPRRSIDPPRFKEDWAALEALLERKYPVADRQAALLPRAVIVDSGGAPGTTANAYAFLRAMRKKGHGGRVFLAKGQGGLKRDRALYVQPEKVLGDRKKRISDLRIVHVGTDPLKDEVALALTRKEPGPNAYHLPDDLPETAFAEFCAEARTDDGWKLRKSGSRNESLDLAVYAKALVIVLKAEKIDWDRPPVWAQPVPENSYALALASEEESAAAPKPAAKSRGRRWRSRGLGG